MHGDLKSMWMVGPCFLFRAKTLRDFDRGFPCVLATLRDLYR